MRLGQSHFRDGDVILQELAKQLQIWKFQEQAAPRLFDVPVHGT